jgi:hypothetical protein
MVSKAFIWNDVIKKHLHLLMKGGWNMNSGIYEVINMTDDDIYLVRNKDDFDDTMQIYLDESVTLGTLIKITTETIFGSVQVYKNIIRSDENEKDSEKSTI